MSGSSGTRIEAAAAAAGDGCALMDLERVISRIVRIGALALFVYGIIVFADQAAGELILRGVALVVSPYIWGSPSPWPLAGFQAFIGLMWALVGFFVFRLKPAESDFRSEMSYFWTILRALEDVVTLFFGLCLVWEILLLIYEPSAMYLQVIQFLAGTGISNMFVMNFSGIMLTFIVVFRLRGRFLHRFPPWMFPEKSTLRFGLLALLVGALTFFVALSLAQSFNFVNVLSQPRTFSCREECFFSATLDLTMAGLGAVALIVGAITSMERLFPREPGR